MSISTETRRKLRLKLIGRQQVSNVPMDIEWLAEDSHAPDLANQELQVDTESLRPIKTVTDPFHTDAEANSVPEFTPIPQTDEYIKTELMSDEEFIDDINDSEAKCKPNTALADDPLVRAGISDKKSETDQSSFHNESPESLREQRKGRSRWERIFKCELCTRVFASKCKMERHLLTHCKDSKREYACNMCENAFFTKAHLVNHKKTHDGFKVLCDVCGSSFTQKGSLDRHMLEKHDVSINTNLMSTFICKECGFSCRRKERLKTHMDMHLRKAATFECGTCSRPLKTEGNLKRHLRSHFKERKQQFACNLCEKKFFNKRTLWLHKMRIHSRKRFICEVCGSSFTQKGSLKTHMFTKHLGKREFPCDFCEKTFGAKSSLNRHRKTHTNESSFICEECGSVFTQKRNLQTHMFRKHFDKAQSITSGPQTADDDSMNESQILKNTQAEDASFETVSCKVCGARLTGGKSLKSHMRRKHSTNTPQSQKASEFPLQTKEELIPDEEFLEEEFLKI